MKKGFGLVDDYYFRITGVQLKQYSGKCFNAIADSADIQGLAHVLERFVMELSLVWRGRSTKSNTQLIPLRGVNGEVQTKGVTNHLTKARAPLIVCKQPRKRRGWVL